MLNGRGRYFAFASALLLIALLGSFGSLALSTNYNDCVGHNGEHATGQTDQEGSPVVEPAIVHPTAVRLFIYCGGLYANENGSGITALATVLLTIVTGLLGYLAWDQGRTTRAQLRPYIWFQAVELHDLQIGALPYVKLVVRNSGETPAYDMEVSAGAIVCEHPIPLDTKFPSITGDSKTKMVVHPTDQQLHEVVANFGSKLPGLSQEQVEGLVRGDVVRLYAFAHAKYRDAFSDAHETWFCVFIDATDDISGKPKYAVTFGYPPIHNSAT